VQTLGVGDQIGVEQQLFLTRLALDLFVMLKRSTKTATLERRKIGSTGLKT